MLGKIKNVFESNKDKIITDGLIALGAVGGMFIVAAITRLNGQQGDSTEGEPESEQPTGSDPA